ncbi:MAG: hypothetical protein ABIG44_15405 [Planctomycetota bacterium]
MVRMHTMGRLTSDGGPSRVAGMCLLLLWISGCQPAAHSPTGPATQPSPNSTPTSSPEAAFTPPEPFLQPAAQQTVKTRIDVLLRVLYVQVPHAQREAVASIWAQLREDVFDSESLLRLERNGIRVGLGRTEHWDTIRATLNNITGQRIHEFPPLRTPPGVPLALELDTQPADHTIFYADRDGVLSGDTWRASQRVLRVTYTLDTRGIDRVFMSVVPEIRQHSEKEWSRGDEGWTTGPRRSGRAFAQAAFALTLQSNEFVLLAPGSKAELYGLVGGAFLIDELDDQRYDSYVFLRIEVNHVDQRR